MKFAGFILTLVFLFPVVCAPGLRCQGQEAVNQSRLLVNVRINKGKLAVDRSKSLKNPEVFRESDLFRANLAGGLTQEKLLDLLFDDLDEAFDRLGKVYIYALPSNENLNEPPDRLTREISDFSCQTDCWKEFREKFEEWVIDGRNKGKTRFELNEIFNRNEIFLAKNFADPLSSTALIFAFTGAPNPVRQEEGALLFRVADPVKGIDEITIAFSGENDNNPPEIREAIRKKKEEIKRLLGSMQGKLWRRKEITSRIEDYYAERGLQAQVVISPPIDQPRKITISENPRIGQLIFRGEIPTETIDKLAYLIFPEREFRLFIGDPSGKRPLEDASVKVTQENGQELTIKRAVTDYNKLGRRPGEEPYLNQFQLQILQLQLADLGFQAIQYSKRLVNEVAYVDVEFIETGKSDKGRDRPPDNAPQPSAPVSNPEGVMKAGVGQSLSRNGFVSSIPSSVGAPTASDTTADISAATAAGAPEQTLEDWSPREKKNYLGLGIEYSPGQNIRAFGIYQRKLPGQSGISLKFGGQGQALGAVNYFADYVLFGALHRRLSIQLTASSDFEANRIFNGAKTDERRTGGLARAELEVFRDLGGMMFRIYLEGRRDTVALIRDDQTIGKQNLTTLDAGSLFLFERAEAYYPKRLRIEPRLRVGLGLSAAESSFTHFSISGNYHQRLSRLLEADVSGRVQLASSRTPIFELPSFGGEETVRGFRRDDAIGRRVWSLQSELWAPVPGLSRSAEGVGRFLRRQVRLAGFADVGGAYQTAGSRSGTRFGPGVGARLIFFPVVIKLDWAYGIGDAAVGRGRGRFYFSVATNLPL